MRKPIRAVAVPVVIVAAIVGAAGYRTQDSGSGRRLDELSRGRPAAATHLPIDGALAAASQAVAEARWTEGSNARQMELFLQAAAENQTLEAQRAQSRKAPARTGRGGGGGGSCNPESIVQRESKGDPNAVNPSSGAGGKYQFLPSTWSGYGGYSRAEDAPESVQDERFNEMWAGGAGSSHWGC
jgi:membrane-bound lytic murein transglycosylase B